MLSCKIGYMSEGDVVEIKRLILLPLLHLNEFERTAAATALKIQFWTPPLRSPMLF